MAKATKARLKVFRTAIGFHDAYVAAPSKKAALTAWGTSKDLFARGAAELVDDPALTAEPLAHPGTVIKRTRGTAEEQAAALPERTSAKRKPASSRPSRAELEQAEQALAEAEARHEKDLAKLRKEEEALAKRRRALSALQETESAKLQARRDTARETYEAALATWRAS